VTGRTANITLELLGRLRIVRVLVGVILDGHLSVGLLDVGLGGILLDAQNVVVVLPFALL